MQASAARSAVGSFNLTRKRVFDLILVCPILLIAAPLMLAAALALWLFDGGPILFRQVRLGMGSRPFELLNFRTMRPASDAAHREYTARWIAQGRPFNSVTGRGGLYKMTHDPRITRVGGILRRFSIDELPQLINMLRGDMSLIGPRPAIPYEVQMYQDWHRRRLDAMPGLTGLWQVSGRNRLSFDEMVQLDIEYVEDWSLYRDLEILVRTLPAMFGGSGL
jgi:lipopolysaccharide/colanic/teichoic acid biosynthesis glycosyltransferase